MTINYNDFLVIIRSVGERTEKACFNLLTETFSSKNILLVKQAPFSAAIRRTFELAMEENLPWTFCVDADVLVDLEQLPLLLQKTLEVSKEIFQIQGLVLDKFFPIWRPAGNHLYRTSLMEKAIFKIPAEGTSLRPETDMLNAMSLEGYPWVQTDIKLGLHDHEQYCEDIYRKCFLQARKHTPFIGLLTSYWEEQRYQDPDFDVALLGLRAGMAYHESIYVDKSFRAADIKHDLANHAIREKDPLPDSMLSFDLTTRQNLKVVDEIQEAIFPCIRWNTLSSSPLYGGEELKEIRFKKYGFKFWTLPGYSEIYSQQGNKDFFADLVYNLAKHTDLFVDVGAYHGFFDLLVASSNPECEVILVETVHENMWIMQQNIVANNISNISILNEIQNENIFYNTQNSEYTIGAELKKILVTYLGVNLLIRIDMNRFEFTLIEEILPELIKKDNINLMLQIPPSMVHSTELGLSQLYELLNKAGYELFLIDERLCRFYRLSDGKLPSSVEYFEGFKLICIKRNRAVSVVFFSHCGELGGSERSLIDLVKQLIQDYGVLCTIYLPEGPSQQYLKDLGAAVVNFSSKWWCGLENNQVELIRSLEHGLSDTFHELMCNLEELRSISPDVICTNTIVIPWGAFAAALAKTPHFWMINEFGEADHQFKFLFSYDTVLSVIDQYSNKIITRSKALQDGLFSQLPIDKVETIYRNIQMPPIIPKTASRTRGTLQLFFPAVIMPSKGQLDAVNACLELLKRGLDIEIIFAGHVADSNYYDFIISRVNASTRQDRFSFLPFQEDISQLYSNADIVLVCSRNESFGRVVLEAMLMGKAVIATDAGGNRELISHGVTGFLYEPGNINVLADNIELIYNDRRIGYSVGERALKFANSEFTNQKFGGRYFDSFLQAKNNGNFLSIGKDRLLVEMLMNEFSLQSRLILEINESYISHRKKLEMQINFQRDYISEQSIELKKIYDSKIWKFVLKLRWLTSWVNRSSN